MSDPHATWEDQAISAIAYAEPEAGRAMVSTLAGEMAPLTILDAFTGERRRCVGLAIQAALRGDCGTQAPDLWAYLDGLPWGEAFALIQGKKPGREDGTGSTLDRIGDPIPTMEGYPQSLTTFRPLCATLRHSARRRIASELVGKIGKALDGLGAGQPPERILGHAIDRIGQVLAGGIGASLGDHAADMLARADAERASARGHIKASWGLDALDVACPMRPGRLIVLAAPPGDGKTSLALQAASASGLRAETGHVGIVSLEMTGGELAAIIAGRQLQLRPGDIREARLDDHDRGRLEELIAQWRGDPALWVSESTSGPYTVDTLAAWARTRHASCGGMMSLLVVDYLQLVDGAQGESEYQTITKTTRALKRLAQALRVPILALSQLSRNGRAEIRGRSGVVQSVPEPRLSDLRGSGSIEQDADAVVFIHQPLPPQERGQTSEAKIIVAKQRAGPIGTVECEFYRPWQIFQARGDTGRAAKLRSQPNEAENGFGI